MLVDHRSYGSMVSTVTSMGAFTKNQSARWKMLLIPAYRFFFVEIISHLEMSSLADESSVNRVCRIVYVGQGCRLQIKMQNSELRASCRQQVKAADFRVQSMLPRVQRMLPTT